jgi:hypothetical protein
MFLFSLPAFVIEWQTFCGATQAGTRPCSLTSTNAAFGVAFSIPDVCLEENTPCIIGVYFSACRTARLFAAALISRETFMG